MTDYISKQDVLNLPQSIERNLCGEIVERSIDVKDIEALEPADVVPTEPQEIGYDQCANAMLKMWMDNVVTDGEYNRIMDRLNKLYTSAATKRRSEDGCEVNKMADYIERQAAIDAFNRIKNTLKNPETAHYDTLMFYEIEDVLEDVEPADVAPVVHGRWVKYTGMGKEQWMCSECSVEEKNPKIARYCYYCGAKMDAHGKE